MVSLPARNADLRHHTSSSAGASRGGSGTDTGGGRKSGAAAAPLMNDEFASQGTPINVGVGLAMGAFYALYFGTPRWE